MNTLVIKFGGASVANLEAFSLISDLIIARMRTFDQVVVVVSAMGDTTDQLEAMAHRVNPAPPKREYDMLLSVGERISMALLAMSLSGKGCKARSFTGSQSGILTSPDHSSAHVVDVQPKRLLEHFGKGEVLIVAGFQGMSRTREITTLGRGGSDITAVALGAACKASHIEFVKDVSGIYDKDPKKHPDAACFSCLDYEEALAVVSRAEHAVLHPRSILLAKKNQLPLFIGSCASLTETTPTGTWIKPNPVTLRPTLPLYELEEVLEGVEALVGQ